MPDIGSIVRFRRLPSGGVEPDPDGEIAYEITDIVTCGGQTCARCVPVDDDAPAPAWISLGEQ